MDRINFLCSVATSTVYRASGFMHNGVELWYWLLLRGAKLNSKAIPTHMWQICFGRCRIWCHFLWHLKNCPMNCLSIDDINTSKTCCISFHGFMPRIQMQHVGEFKVSSILIIGQEINIFRVWGCESMHAMFDQEQHQNMPYCSRDGPVHLLAASSRRLFCSFSVIKLMSLRFLKQSDWQKTPQQSCVLGHFVGHFFAPTQYMHQADWQCCLRS